MPVTGGGVDQLAPAVGPNYILWEDTRAGHSDIYFAPYITDTTTWGAYSKVNDDVGTASQHDPDAASDAAGHIYAVWQDTRAMTPTIYFARSSDAGITWSTNIALDASGGAVQQAPAIAATDGGSLCAVWSDRRNGNFDIYAICSNDGGLNWGNPAQVNDAGDRANQYAPTIAVGDGGRMHVTWWDDRNGVTDIYAAYSADGGASWSADVRVNDNRAPSFQYDPVIAARTGVVYVAWRDARDGNYDIYVASSRDAGVTWAPGVRVNDIPLAVDLDSPAIVATDDDVCVAWQDKRTLHAKDIYLACSRDQGVTWEANRRVNLDTHGRDQGAPALGTDGEIIWVAWEDARNGWDTDVYFRARRSVTPAQPIAPASVTISGPATGRFHQAYTFTASIVPAVAAKSVTYTWSPVPDFGQGTAQVGYTWSAAGRQGITLTVDNRSGARTANHTILISEKGEPISTVEIEGPTEGQTEQKYTFSVGFVPITATVPITFTWSPVPDLGQGTAQVDYLWMSPGQKDVIVTATTYAGTKTDSHQVIVSAEAVFEWGLKEPDNAQVLDEPATQAYPDVAVDSAGRVYAAWQDYRSGTYEIYVARSADGGETWGSGVKVNDVTITTTSDVDISIVTTQDDRPCLAWRDFRADERGDIYFTCSDDGGGTWRSNIRINDDDPGSYQQMPSLDVGSDGTLYAVWSDYRDSGHSEVYFSKSKDGGVTWHPNAVVNCVSTDHQYRPVITVDQVDGTLYVVWEDYRDGEWNIYVAHSGDDGATWAAGQRVNDDIGGSFSPEQRYPDVAAHQGHVYVVWRDLRNGRADVFFARSDDGGSTWRTNFKLDDNFGRYAHIQDDPHIAVDRSGVIYAIWDGNNDIYLTYSQDKGRTWQREVRVNAVTGSDQVWPALTVGAIGDVYIVWGDKQAGNWDIYAAHIAKTDIVWSTESGPHDGADYQSLSNLVAEGDEVFATWQDYRNGNWDIYCAHSSDGGTIWGAAVRVNDDVGFAAQADPAIARANDGTLYIVWADHRPNADGFPNADIYLASSSDDGLTWHTNVQVNDAETILIDQAYPHITVDPDNAQHVYVAWTDWRELYRYRVYFSASFDGGKTWSADTRISDYTGGRSAGLADIAFNPVDGSIYAVWHDWRASHWDIYASRSDDGGQSWTPNLKISDGVNDRTQADAALAINGHGHILVAWRDERNNHKDIYFARSTDRAETWSPNVRVNDDAGTAQQQYPDIDVDANNVIYIVWVDERDSTDDDVYLSRSWDNGTTWEPNQRVDDGPGGLHGGEANIAVGGDNKVYAMWQMAVRDYWIYDLYFDRSLDDGVTWGSDMPSVGGGVHQSAPAVSRGYVLWADDRAGNSDIYFAAYQTSSKVWGPDIKVSDDVSTTAQFNPAVAHDGAGNVYAVWQDERAVTSTIYFAYKSPVSATWSANFALDNSSSRVQQDPAIAVTEAGEICAAWSDQRNGDFDIYATCSADGGMHWHNPTRVNDDLGGANQYAPAIATTADGRMHVTWWDERDGVTTTIYAAYSADDGVTWSPNRRISDLSNADARYPAIATHDSAVYVAWRDSRDGEYDIYAATSLDSGDTWLSNVRVNHVDLGADDDMPAIVAGDDQVCVAWTDKRAGNADIYLVCSADAGATWRLGQRANLDAGTRAQTAPALSLDLTGQALWLVWQDERNGHDRDVYLRRLTFMTATTPISVAVQGPTDGFVNVPHQFMAFVTPVTVTLPLTFTWQATGQPQVTVSRSEVDLKHAVSFTWTVPGKKLITVTVTNEDETVIDTYQIDIYKTPPPPPPPIDNIAIVGKPSVQTHTTYRFTTTVTPITTATPIRYMWFPSPLDGQGKSWASYAWFTEGEKVITVTAANAGGYATATHTVMVFPNPVCAPLKGMTLLGPTAGFTGTAYLFTAIITPAQATLPFTYTWTPLPDAQHSPTVVAYTWDTPGVYSVTATTVNCNGSSVVSETKIIKVMGLAAPQEGDAYEPDNVCDQASPISLDSVAQAHTFHKYADEDWVSFQATAGITYIIQAQVPATSSANVTLELHQACDPGPVGSWGNVLGPGVSVRFKAPVDGMYHVRLKNDPVSVYGDKVTYRLSVCALKDARVSGAVVIVAGKLKENDPLQRNIHNVTDAVYRFALDHGCDTRDIYYLATDVNRPGLNDVATLPNLAYALTAWPVDKVGPERPLTLFMMDHGGNDEFYLNGANEKVTPQELAAWIDILEQKTGASVNVVLDACNSGSFIQPSPSISQVGRDRVIIASTGGNARAFATQNGSAFSDAFLDALAQQMTLEEAFKRA